MRGVGGRLQSRAGSTFPPGTGRRHAYHLCGSLYRTNTAPCNTIRSWKWVESRVRSECSLLARERRPGSAAGTQAPGWRLLAGGDHSSQDASMEQTSPSEPDPLCCVSNGVRGSKTLHKEPPLPVFFADGLPWCLDMLRFLPSQRLAVQPS